MIFGFLSIPLGFVGVFVFLRVALKFVMVLYSYLQIFDSLLFLRVSLDPLRILRVSKGSLIIFGFLGFLRVPQDLLVGFLTVLLDSLRLLKVSQDSLVFFWFLRVSQVCLWLLRVSYGPFRIPSDSCQFLLVSQSSLLFFRGPQSSLVLVFFKF